ncbi:hypothetical protein [Micromonospora okii]|uniref:hypothetical protein n=1 Tax=Micromonospora okii TaxID=1182970 RepID=UPI001E4FDF8B|nr:hypothetical protein [Micromonospora okii]
MVHKPAWFRDGEVFVSYAPTCGINKDGEELYVVDPETGQRTDVIDDRMADDVDRLLAGLSPSAEDTRQWISRSHGEPFTAVPVYFDERPQREFEALLEGDEFEGWSSASLGELTTKRWVRASAGHGSPSADLRTGEVPYIKVSDIRAGLVNINPSNRVSSVVAERFWGGLDSGLQAWDLITPIRTSKNIGEFAVLMPGQERVVLTKEMLVLRAADDAPFDNFYLLWAMTLKAVRRQWGRVIFMQTNREDVGPRYREIKIPIPPTPDLARAASQAFRTYYTESQKIREAFLTYLAEDDRHHVFLSSVEAVEEAAEEDSEA